MYKSVFFAFLCVLFSSCFSSKSNSIDGVKPIELNAENFQSTIIENENISVVYFWAVWCGPCRMTGPVMNDLAKTEIGNTTYGKVNVDENEELAVRYGIRSIPTILIMKNGKVVDKYVGVFTKDLVGDLIKTHS